MLNKKVWTLFAATVVVSLVLLYHTGVAAENECIASGNSAAQCATLRL